MRILYILIFTIVFSGCVWPLAKPGVSDTPVVSQPVAADGDIQAYVKNPDRLAQGGNVLIARFLPGERAAATQEFDEVMSMFRQSMGHALEQYGGAFTVVGPLDDAETDIVVRGVVRRLERQGKWAKWFSFSNKAYCVIDVDILTADSEERIVSFTHSKEVDLNKGAMKDLGYKMGVDVARFMARFTEDGS